MVGAITGIPIWRVVMTSRCLGWALGLLLCALADANEHVPAPAADSASASTLSVAFETYRTIAYAAPLAKLPDALQQLLASVVPTSPLPDVNRQTCLEAIGQAFSSPGASATFEYMEAAMAHDGRQGYQLPIEPEDGTCLWVVVITYTFGSAINDYNLLRAVLIVAPPHDIKVSLYPDWDGPFPPKGKGALDTKWRTFFVNSAPGGQPSPPDVVGPPRVVPDTDFVDQQPRAIGHTAAEALQQRLAAWHWRSNDLLKPRPVAHAIPPVQPQPLARPAGASRLDELLTVKAATATESPPLQTTAESVDREPNLDIATFLQRLDTAKTHSTQISSHMAELARQLHTFPDVTDQDIERQRQQVYQLQAQAADLNRQLQELTDSLNKLNHQLTDLRRQNCVSAEHTLSSPALTGRLTGLPASVDQLRQLEAVIDQAIDDIKAAMKQDVDLSRQLEAAKQDLEYQLAWLKIKLNELKTTPGMWTGQEVSPRHLFVFIVVNNAILPRLPMDTLYFEQIGRSKDTFEYQGKILPRLISFKRIHNGYPLEVAIAKDGVITQILTKNDFDPRQDIFYFFVVQDSVATFQQLTRYLRQQKCRFGWDTALDNDVIVNLQQVLTSSEDASGVLVY